MSEQEKKFSDFFPPLTSETVIKISLEGPNGGGKTKSGLLVPTAVRALEATSLQKDQYCAPLVKIAEPPKIPVGSNREDTWRMWTKEGISKDGVFTAEQLHDPYWLANLFLLARRHIEALAISNFPLLIKESQLYNSPWSQHAFSFGRENGIRSVYTQEELNASGCGVLLTDRGSLSTLRYQAQTVDGVIHLMRRMYGEGFLLKEDMTIVIVPTNSNSQMDIGRDVIERDQHNDGENPATSYLNLRGQAGEIMTKNFVAISNDPTGERNTISTTTFLISLLVKAAIQSKRNGPNIQWSTPTQIAPFGLKFKPYEFFEYMDIAEINFSHNCSRVLNLLRDKGFYASGDIALTGLNPNGANLIFMEDLEGKITRGEMKL